VAGFHDVSARTLRVDVRRPTFTVATLGAFDARSNAITPIRLGLAITVLVSHSFTIGRFGLEPLVAESKFTASAGLVAVLAFFALSGFLIASSRERTAVVPFVRNRLGRILPGYWLALAYVAFVGAPVGAALLGRPLQIGDQLAYVGPRMVFLAGSEAGVSQAYDGARINGSLWTLPIELMCYGVLAIVPAKLLGPVALGDAVLLFLLFLAVPSWAGPETGLMFSFCLGVVAWRWRSHIPVSWIGVAIAVASLGAGTAAGSLPLMVLGVAYLALCSAWLPLRLSTDLSYGIYVLAYPTQTLLVIAGIGTSVLLLVGVSLAVVLPLAWLSWRFVEQPALRLARRH
jgi:peptidoglycan/LPS O-acetylase OafA/YrhL